MTHRYIVVVPPSAPETLAYLTESFKNVADVQVVADRRRTSGTSVRPLVDRRASTGHWSREAFGCTLVRVARPEPAPAAASAPLIAAVVPSAAPGAAHPLARAAGAA